MNKLTSDVTYYAKGTYFKRLIEITDRKFGKDSFKETANSMNIEMPEIILSSTKYNWVECCKILEFLMNRNGVEHYDFYLELTVYAVESDLNSIYKMFMGFSGPKFVLGMMPSISKAYNNWIPVEIITNESGYFKAKYSFPAIVHFEQFTPAAAVGAITASINACKYKIDKISYTNPRQSMEMSGKKEFECEAWYSSII